MVIYQAHLSALELCVLGFINSTALCAFHCALRAAVNGGAEQIPAHYEVDSNMIGEILEECRTKSSRNTGIAGFMTQFKDLEVRIRGEEKQTSPQAKRHELSLQVTFKTIFTFLTIFTS